MTTTTTTFNYVAAEELADRYARKVHGIFTVGIPAEDMSEYSATYNLYLEAYNEGWNRAVDTCTRMDNSIKRLWLTAQKAVQPERE